MANSSSTYGDGVPIVQPSDATDTSMLIAGTLNPSTKCHSCGVSLEKKSKANTTVSHGQTWCTRCYRHNSITTTRSASQEAPQRATEEETEVCAVATLPLPRTVESHEACIFRCKPVSKQDLRFIGKEGRMQALVHTGVHVPYKSRCCSIHLSSEGLLTEESLKKLPDAVASSTTTASPQMFVDLINDLRKRCLELESCAGEVSFNRMNDDEIKSRTGRTRAQFEEMLECIPETRRPKSLALGVYLTYLYRALSQEQIAVDFRLTQGTVSKYIGLIRSQLTEHSCSE